MRVQVYCVLALGSFLLGPTGPPLPMTPCMGRYVVCLPWALSSQVPRGLFHTWTSGPQGQEEVTTEHRNGIIYIRKGL